MTKGYTGKERVEAAFSRDYADRVPVDVQVPRIAELCGISQVEFLTDPEKELMANMKAHELFPSDIVHVPGYRFTTEGATALWRITRGPNAEMPRPSKSRAEILEGYRPRHPRESRTYAPFLEMCRRVKAMYQDFFVVALGAGPWTEAMGLRGTENFIYDTIDDPQFVHDLVKLTTEQAKRRGEAIAETGANVVFGDPSAGCSLISPDIYRTFIKPRHTELFRYMKTLEPRAGLHVCGYVDPIIKDLVSLPLDWIELDAPSSLEKMVEGSQKKVVIRGNLAAELFGEGTKEEIEEAVKHCIEVAAKGSAYILSPGCTIAANTPLENVRYYVEAAYKYGRYQN